ncbi:MAG: hypothetical protein IBX60_06105 [Candidatus Aminicenantes bacterium]|nr:hypothetical protein [Candidatus Aminicenantes bacterium]
MKSKILGFFLILCLGLFLNSQEHEDVTINTRVESRCKLEVSTNFISFTKEGPDLGHSIIQNEPPVEVTVKITPRRNERVYLRIWVDSDLIDQRTGRKIDAENIYWEASKGFNNGNLSKAAPQVIGNWKKSGIWEGTITFYLLNKPDYAPGVYTLTVSMVLSPF